MKEIYITTEYIKLVQFLKFADLLDQGSDFTYFIEENTVELDGQEIIQKGKKIYPGSTVLVNGESFIIRKDEN